MKINIESSIYPKQLKKLERPPQALNIKGKIELLKTNRNSNNRNKKTYKIWRRNC